MFWKRESIQNYVIHNTRMMSSDEFPNQLYREQGITVSRSLGSYKKTVNLAKTLMSQLLLD